MPLRTLVLAASKGGVGKTTIAAALAVRASAESSKVALIDLDPQNSLARWFELRGDVVKNPHLFTNVESPAEAVEALAADGWQWCIIDTPPALIHLIEPAIEAATFVLIPTRASALDVEAIDPVVELCRMYSKPFAFVLNAAEPKWRLTKTAVQYLEATEGTVLATGDGYAHVCYRQAYIAAMTVGKSGPEIEPGARKRRATTAAPKLDDMPPAQREIEALWQAVKSAMPARKAARSKIAAEGSVS